MSAIRGTGVAPWIKLSVTEEDVKEPRPIKRAADRKSETNENHGLWAFFNPDKTILTTPYEEGRHGRAWTVEELRRKGWNDLHSLWWTCLKERNRILTEEYTRKELNAGYGEFEATERIRVVGATMENIKFALRERWHAYEDANKLARTDPSVYVDKYNTLAYDMQVDLKKQRQEKRAENKLEQRRQGRKKEWPKVKET